METALAELMEWTRANPNWAGLVVMAVSALESFLVVGLFVPGSVVMFGIGAMVAAGHMELWPTLAWATFGAVLGDGTSYLIGRFYHQRLRVMWPFRKYPQMIARGVEFFHKHGGKSIILARFVGPVRPLVPAVAGMLDMPASRFFAVNILSALIWAPAYVLPGMLFGASLGLAAEVAGRLAALLVILLVVLWLSWWLMIRIGRSFQAHAQSLQTGILEWSRRHPSVEPLAAALLDPNHPEARGMSVLTGILLIASLALLLIPKHLAADGLFGNLDLYLFNLLQELRSPFGDRLLVITTELGSRWVLYSFTALLSLWLLWRRRWRATLHWLLTVGFVSLVTDLLKLATRVQRPPVLDTAVLSYSFPSGHASLSVAVFGFLAVMIARELRSNWHWIPYSLAVFPGGCYRVFAPLPGGSLAVGCAGRLESGAGMGGADGHRLPPAPGAGDFDQGLRPAVSGGPAADRRRTQHPATGTGSGLLSSRHRNAGTDHPRGLARRRMDGPAGLSRRPGEPAPSSAQCAVAGFGDRAAVIPRAGGLAQTAHCQPCGPGRAVQQQGVDS